jgi:hypothetical protein
MAALIILHTNAVVLHGGHDDLHILVFFSPLVDFLLALRLVAFNLFRSPLSLCLSVSHDAWSFGVVSLVTLYQMEFYRLCPGHLLFFCDRLLKECCTQNILHITLQRMTVKIYQGPNV